MSEDRKAKLEKIRKMKAEYLKMLEECNAAAVPTKIDLATSSAVTSGAASEVPSSYGTQRRSITFKKDKKAMLKDPTKQSLLLKIQMKKINNILKEEKFENTYQGIPIEKKDVDTQYEIPKEYEEEFKKRQTEKKMEEMIKMNEKKEKLGLTAKRSSLITSSLDLTRLRTTSKDSMIDQDKGKDIDLAIEKNQFPESKCNELLKQYEQKFLEFYEKDKELFEEALGVNDIFDIFGNYYINDESNVTKNNRTMATLFDEFGDEMSNGRSLVSLEWSQKHTDLFLASFSESGDFNQQSGLIQVWSISNKKNPKYVLTYQTQLTSAIFHNYNPKLILGGTYTGQLLVWDMKSKPIPVQKSVIGGTSNIKSHNLPINCLAVMGSESESKIISVSSDGILCEWSLNNLSQPIFRFELKQNKIEEIKNLNEIGTLCVGFNPQIPQSLLVGSDDNNIYQINLEDQEAKDHIINTYTGNGGPVFSVDLHPTNQENGNAFSDLFLTSGADWSTKLYSTSIHKPLLSFEFGSDYVYSAKWHPINPSIFATCNGQGTIDFWDLNKDREIPYFKYELNTVLNSLAWSADGQRLAVGDINGKVNIFNAEKEVYTVKPESVNKFENIINGIKQAKLNEESVHESKE